ncbi:MAG: hypothetical protein JRJ87_19860, partial [Deltaproteobacteria bacterium]|nr:hypothetical protein [Deltaproteobacteria bacterium]
MKSCMIFVFGLLVLGGLAQAEEKQEAKRKQPECLPGWQLPSPKVQMEMDSELIPVGKGAIFVPAMTDPGSEPPYVVI